MIAESHLIVEIARHPVGAAVAAAVVLAWGISIGMLCGWLSDVRRRRQHRRLRARVERERARWRVPTLRGD